MAPLRTPIDIQVQPTNRCNANCLFCWIHDNNQVSAELSDEKWLELTDEICALDIPKVLICGGGEPLLRGRLVLQMMKKFCLAGMQGTLLTNGMLITEQLAMRMVKMRWKSVQVSIHGPTSKINDVLMDKKGALHLALRGIENLNRYKILLKSALPELAMRIVVTKLNLSTLPEYIRLAHSQGVSKVYIRMDNQAETTNQRIPSVPEMKKASLKETLECASKVAEELLLQRGFIAVELFESLK